jgi:hypothetical protein
MSRNSQQAWEAQSSLNVPVIRVEMDEPCYWGVDGMYGGVYDGMYDGMHNYNTVDAGGFTKWVKRTGYSIFNHLPFEVNALIDAVISQEKEVLKKMKNQPQLTDARQLNQYYIDALQPLMEKTINLQNYYKQKSGVPVQEGRWTANIHPTMMEHSTERDVRLFDTLYQDFLHWYTEFEHTIWDLAKTNQVPLIIQGTNHVFVTLFNLQNYYLGLNGC